jgi:hypothetical protein
MSKEASDYPTVAAPGVWITVSVRNIAASPKPCRPGTKGVGQRYRGRMARPPKLGLSRLAVAELRGLAQNYRAAAGRNKAHPETVRSFLRLAERFETLAHEAGGEDDWAGRHRSIEPDRAVASRS